MAYSLKENLMKEDRLSGGHRMCAGCGSPIAVRTVLRALNPEDKAVVCSATSCLEVSTFMYPYTAWKDSFIHNAFENAAATLSGVETAYRAMKKRASWMIPTSSSPSAATAAPTTSASRACPAPWSVATTWYTCATTTRRT